MIMGERLNMTTDLQWIAIGNGYIFRQRTAKVCHYKHPNMGAEMALFTISAEFNRFRSGRQGKTHASCLVFAKGIRIII
jgi:hypothetical protein